MPLTPPTVFTTGKTVASAFLNTEIDRRSQNPAAYEVWFDGTNWHGDSMNGGTDATPGTDAATVAQFALNNLTSGRTWKERVVLKGGTSYGISTTLKPTDYTILDCSQAFLQWNTNAVPSGATFGSIIQNVNADSGTANHDIEVWPGTMDGNSANQTNEANRALLNFRSAYNITIFPGVYQNFKGLAGVGIQSAGGQAQVNNQNVNIYGGFANNISGTAQSESGSGLQLSGSGIHSYGFEATACRQGIQMDADSFVGHNYLIAPYVHDLTLNANSGAGISVLTQRTHILNPTVSKAGTHGILISTGGNDSEVIGGLLIDNGQQFANNGVTLNNVTGCRIQGVRATSTQAGQTYGIAESGTANNNIVLGCDCRGNQNGSLDISLVGVATKIAYCLGRYSANNAGIVATYSTTGNTAAVTNAINYVPPALAGTYRLSATVVVTAWTTPATFNILYSYKDATGTLRSGEIMPAVRSGGGEATSITAVDRWYGQSILVQIDNSATAVTLSTSGTFTGSPVYNLAATLENIVVA